MWVSSWITAAFGINPVFQFICSRALAVIGLIGAETAFRISESRNLSLRFAAPKWSISYLKDGLNGSQHAP